MYSLGPIRSDLPNLSTLAKELSDQSPQVRTNGSESSVHGKQEAEQGKGIKATRKNRLVPGRGIVEADARRAEHSTRHGARDSHGGVLVVEAARSRIEESVAEQTDLVDGVALEVLEVGGQGRRDVDVGAGAVVANGAGVLELDAFRGVLIQVEKASVR